MRQCPLRLRSIILMLPILSAGCGHRVIHSTTQMSPAGGETRAIPQPLLRRILRDLAAQGVTDAADATVFVLGSWILDTAEDPNRKFEGAPFRYEGAKVFLTVGPADFGRKHYSPPREDLLARTKEKDSLGATIIMAGQRWQVGFSMKTEDEKLADGFVQLLMQELRRYRDTIH